MSIVYMKSKHSDLLSATSKCFLRGNQLIILRCLKPSFPEIW